MRRIGLLGLVALLLAACGSDRTGSKGGEQSKPPILAAEGPPCQFVDFIPYHNVRTTCVESIYDNVMPSEGAPALMGLALSPDDQTLYMARTATGEIWAMRDTGGFMGEAFRVAEGLRLPTGLAASEDALYVVSVGGVIRLSDPDPAGIFQQQTVLADDLPADTLYWPRGIGIGPDDRLYVGAGDVLLSMTLDGDDQRVEAGGFTGIADFDWDPVTGELWVVDGPSGEMRRTLPDSGAGVTFPAHSNPSSMVFYTSDGFPFWENDPIVVLNGSWNQPDLAGYALEAVRFEGGEPDGRIDQIAPADTSYWYNIPLANYSLIGRGFFPYHPVDVVVSGQGWLYVSLQEGRIYRFRPRPEATADD